MPDEVCVLNVQWRFQYFNRPRWGGRGDGRCYITRSPLLYIFFVHCASFNISLLNNIFKSILRVKRFLGQADTMSFPKEKGKKNGSHLSGSCFECSVNNNVILNTQFSIS